MAPAGPRRNISAKTPAAPPPSLPAEQAGGTGLKATLIVYALVQLLYLSATPLQTIALPDNLPLSGPQSLLVGIGPDEKEHFLYALSLADRGALPAPHPRFRSAPEAYVSYQAQHPPLFYALAAVVVKLARPLGAPALWYLLRGLCALCGAVVIVLAAKAARAAFPDRPAVFLAAAPFVAFLPMFGHLTGNLSNEPLAMVLGAWAWLQIVRLIRAGRPSTTREAALLGATLGLAALTRLTALSWLPAALIALVWAARPEDKEKLLFVHGRKLAFAGQRDLSLAAFGACFAALVAPWFLYNQLAFGTPFLRTFDRPLLAYGSPADFVSAGITPPGFVPINARYTALWYASTSWFPYWLVQFYLPGGLRAAPAWQAVLLLADVAIALLLFLNASRARRGLAGEKDPAGRVLLGAATAALGFCVLALVWQQLFSDWNVVNSAGRYTVAIASASALLFLFAVSTLLWRRPAVAAVIIAALMLAFDLYTALLVRRFYAEHPTQNAEQRISRARGAGENG